VVTFSAVPNLKILNLSLRIAKGCYFAGFKFASPRNFSAPFLPTEWWHPHEQPLVTGQNTVSFGRDGKTLLLFSRPNSVDVRLILVDILMGAFPTDSLFLAHTVSPQSILYLLFVVAPCVVPANNTEQMTIALHLVEEHPYKNPQILYLTP